MTEFLKRDFCGGLVRARQHGLLKPEELDLFEIGPAGPVREGFPFGVGESAADGKARVVAHHGVPDDEGGEEPDAEGGQSAADEIDAGGAMASDPGHFAEHGKGVLFGEVMEGEAAKDKVGALVAEGELARIGLDEEHFLSGGRGAAGDLKRLELHVNGHDGDFPPAGPGAPDEVAAMIAVAGGKVDEDEFAGLVGQLVEDGLHGFPSAEGAIEAGEIFEIAAQCVFILVGQIHQLGVGFGEFTLHPSENAHSWACVTVFFAKK
jgi:hypothetical protein